MAKRSWKSLHCVPLCALALLTSMAGTWTTSVSADVAAQEDCSDWEDWDNARFWGLWTDRYHISSSPDFNPHEESRWWDPVRIVWADGRKHYTLVPGYTLEERDHDHVHRDCGWV